MWGVFPRWLGYLNVAAGPLLILNSFLIFMVPGYDGAISFFFMAPYFISLVWLAGWLLINTPHPSKNREFGATQKTEEEELEQSQQYQQAV